MELGNRIKQHRTAHGWSQDDLAEKAYVSRQTISNWENNIKATPICKACCFSAACSASPSINWSKEISKSCKKPSISRISTPSTAVLSG